MEQLQSLVYEIFFTPNPKKYQKWIVVAWLLVLFLGGIYVWGNFFAWGDIPLTLADWSRVAGPRLTFLKDAVTRGVLPLHISDIRALDKMTNRYMGVPIVLLSPQIFLLRFLEVGEFFLTHIWLMYALGYLGLLWLRRQFNLSAFAFTVLFLLFNFNGHIFAHLFIGHENWGGYFLFPWFVGLVFNLVKGKGGWNWALKMASLLFLIFLQGSFHHWSWSLMFLAMMMFFVPRHFWDIFKAGVGAFALAMVRILPVAVTTSLIVEDYNYIGGFIFSDVILDRLIFTANPVDHLLYYGFLTRSLGTWEFTMFVGAVGTFFLIFFGVYRALIHNENRVILLPVSGLAILSLGKIYKYLWMLPVPIFKVERVSSRILILALVFLFIFAVIELQRWLDTNKHRVQMALLAVALPIFLANDLWHNYKLWLISRVAPIFVLGQGEFNATEWFVANDLTDNPYIQALWIGLVISICSAAAMFYLAWRERKREPQPEILTGSAADLNSKVKNLSENS